MGRGTAPPGPGGDPIAQRLSFRAIWQDVDKIHGVSASDRETDKASENELAMPNRQRKQLPNPCHPKCSEGSALPAGVSRQVQIPRCERADNDRDANDGAPLPGE